MWWVGVFGCSCSSSSMLASEQCLGDVNMVWYGFSLWSLLRYDITEHILWAVGWASGQSYVSLQVMLFEGGSFPYSYGEGPFLFIRANVTYAKFAECLKILTRLCKVCHWCCGLWCCSVMLGHVLWSQTPDVSPSLCSQGQSLVLLWTIRQMLLQHLFHGCDNTGEQSL